MPVWAAPGAEVTWGEGHGGDRLWSAEPEFYKKLQVVALEPGKAVIIRRDLAINLYGLSPGSRK